MLTHPVVFTKRERDRLKEAAALAGFDDVTLLEEPVAAVLGYAASGAPVGKGVLVYDLGGGTLDLAFVKHEDAGGYRVPVESMGDSNCAGDVLDQILYGHWEKESSPQIGPGFGMGDASINLPVLMECRKSKEKLSSAARASLSYLAPQLNTHMVLGIGRKDFDRLIEDRVQVTVGLTKSFLARVEAAGEKVDTVLLIGGSTRVPMVRRELEKVLPVKPIETMHTDVAVAMGAAVVGEDRTRLLGDGQFKVAAGNQRQVVCPACKAKNPEEARFCEECGAALTRLCPECGRENPVQKRYCSSCGTGWEVFLKLQEALQAAEKLGKQAKWKEAQAAVSPFGEMNLPGGKGQQLAAGVRSTLRKAAKCIAEGEAAALKAAGEASWAAGRWEEAIQKWQAAELVSPSKETSWLIADGQERLEKWTTCSTNANKAVAREDYPAAIVDLNEAVTLRPTDEEGRIDLAETKRKYAAILASSALKAMEASEWQSALELIEQCRDLDPERNRDWDRLAATAADGVQARA